jgi:hypothetical protein
MMSVNAGSSCYTNISTGIASYIFPDGVDVTYYDLIESTGERIPPGIDVSSNDEIDWYSWDGTASMR